MSHALTLTEAAERLAPVFVEGPESPAAVPAKPGRGRWLSLDDAGAVLSQRVTGQQPAPRKTQTDVTVKQAARQIEQPRTPAAVLDLRKKRLTATAAKVQGWNELEEFTKWATPHFEGRDDTVLADPFFQEVYTHALKLRAAYDSLVIEEEGAWNRQCEAESDAFNLERPEWGARDTSRVAAMLGSLGLTEQEIGQLWSTLQPININSPICMTLAKLSLGDEHQQPIQAALAAVGYDDQEIADVMSGQDYIFLRDHRIQELVARAADGYTPTENRTAA